MHSLRSMLLVVPLLGIALGRPAQAQVQYRPSATNQPPSQTQVVSMPTVAPVAPAPAPPPGYPYPGYPVIQGRTAGTLNGTANLVNAYGQYQTQYREGQLMNQQVIREQYKTR